MSQHGGKKEKDNNSDITKEAEIWHAVSTLKYEIILVVLNCWLGLFFQSHIAIFVCTICG